MTTEQRKTRHLNWPTEPPAKAAKESASIPLVEGTIPGQPIRLSLLRADGSGLALILGPSEAVAIASELLQAVRVRTGRAEWPPR